MNSDAMGKSLQGVSGAIVIGVSFNLFINRTKKHGYYSKVTPEEWIKESTRDLQRVFSGFNGAMLAILETIEETDGDIYKTLDKLSKKGDFIDDISLLSVKYIPSKS